MCISISDRIADRRLRQVRAMTPHSPCRALRRVSVFCPLVVGLTAFAICLSAQIQTPNAPQALGKPVRVTGVVTNSLTGAGVPHALVQAFGQSQQSVLTGADGRFELIDLPEGQYSFVPQKPGFFNQQEVSGGPVRMGTVTVREGMGDVPLALIPEGTIDGHVTDEDGEPLENVDIWLLRSIVQEGRRRWEPAGGVTSDASGAYHIGGLSPGLYAIRAQGDQSTEPPRPTGQNFSLVLAATYYPGAPTLDQAAPVKIAAGQQAQIDFAMKRQPAYRISGVVTNPPPEGLGMYLRQGEQSTNLSVVVSRNGAFRTASVSPGIYTLVAQSHNNESPLIAEIQATVSDADVTGVQLILDRPSIVPVQVTLTKTRSSDASSQPTVYPSDGPSAQGSNRRLSSPNESLGQLILRRVPLGGGPSYSVNLHEVHSADDAIVIQNLTPGNYQLTSLIRPSYYLESVRCGDTDLLESQLVVTAGSAPPPIQISVRDDAGMIAMHSVEDGKPAPASILLIPNRGEPREFGFASDASFQVAPGTYKVYAFDTLADLEYLNPDVMREYASGGQEVTVAANGSATVTVEVIHRGAQ